MGCGMNDRPFSRRVIWAVVKVRSLERLQMLEVEVAPGCWVVGGWGVEVGVVLSSDCWLEGSWFGSEFIVNLVVCTNNRIWLWLLWGSNGCCPVLFEIGHGGSLPGMDGMWRWCC